ncbi:MAG: lactate utilization protein C [Propionibacteriaceae bacterium]|jgi:L-lactate dehydrogenase complex protein LldG|nr:lactate utilization protein C [Propionibacteriaceae bacterium]
MARIKSSLADVPDIAMEEDTPIDYTYGEVLPMDDVLGTFEEALIDYKAAVTRVKSADVPKAIAKFLKDKGAKSVVIPVGLEQSWIDGMGKFSVRKDDPQLTNYELNDTDAVVTAARVAIASTGSIVLDHAPDQGRRALTLVPDIHVCVVAADQVVSDVPESVTRLRDSVLAGLPLTFISGGSATSDIELNRVEGVHGPRKLCVVIAE